MDSTSMKAMSQPSGNMVKRYIISHYFVDPFLILPFTVTLPILHYQNIIETSKAHLLLLG
jgi:hypothetical protein